MLHIALCINDQSGSYHKHALVTAVSAMKNSSCDLTFHIFHDDSLLPNMNKFEQAAAQYHAQIRFYNLEKHDFSQMAPYAAKWGKGALYRLVLQEYLSTPLVLYLDCDTVVTMDLRSLENFDLAGATAAVVREKAVVRQLREDMRHLKKLGIPPERYFNSGVMLINSEKLRQAGAAYTDEILGYLASNTSYPDQDALNLYFARRKGEVVFLEDRYNEQINFAAQDAHLQEFAWYNGKILHYASPKKPWLFFSNAAVLYWKYYAMAFPDEDVFELIAKTEQHKFAGLCRFVLGSVRMRGFVRRMRDISEGGLWYTLRKRIFPK